MWDVVPESGSQLETMDEALMEAKDGSRD